MSELNAAAGSADRFVASQSLNETSDAERSTSRRARPWWVTPESIIYAVVLALFATAALAPSLFTQASPTIAVPQERMLAPSLGHPFGTDQIGRDVFTRVIYGAQLSLRAGLIAVLIAFVGGSLLGILAGYVGGWVDTVISRISDSVLAIPGLLFSLALMTGLGNGSLTAALAIGLANIPSFTRVMRAEAMRVRTSVFVEAARTTGGSSPAILRRHVLPNSVGPVINLAVLEFGQSMLIISSLSYLGFGDPPPSPEWGALIASGQPYLATAWWLSIMPGLVLATVVLTVNRTAHFLQGRS